MCGVRRVGNYESLEFLEYFFGVAALIRHRHCQNFTNRFPINIREYRAFWEFVVISLDEITAKLCCAFVFLRVKKQMVQSFGSSFWNMIAQYHLVAAWNANVPRSYRQENTGRIALESRGAIDHY